MAYYGKVLYLMDERYMNLQDVYDNIQPLPMLVPPEEYKQNIVVYQTSTSHEITLGIIQDLTSQRGIEAGEELWAWFAQWEIEGSQTEPPRPAKKARVWPPVDPQSSKHQEAAKIILERRILPASLMQEEDMLRILIDIVQVDSSLVPNFIEFLYRWVDFFEGDGMALKGALKGEIPSLWDFEFHPLVLPKSMQKATGAAPGDSSEQSDTDNDDQTVEYNPKVEEVAMSSPTKRMRSKPNLAALERQTLQTEESERLQYREVKFGLQPPRLKETLPPLINIPQDQQKRIKYYAACFKSRHRALHLLQEAGISVRQIANYQKLQPLHPQQTPDTEGGDGLRHYWKDAQYAQQRFEMTEQITKQREIAISNKLAVEAMLAARTAVEEGSSGVPLIPPTPSYNNPRQPDMAAEMLKKIQAKKKERPDRITVIPAPLVGLLKSDLFKGAKCPEQIFAEKLASGESKDSDDSDEDDNNSDTVQPPAGFAPGSWGIPGSYAPPPPFPPFYPPFPPPANGHGGPGFNGQGTWASSFPTHLSLNQQNTANFHAPQSQPALSTTAQPNLTPATVPGVNIQPHPNLPPLFIPPQSLSPPSTTTQSALTSTTVAGSAHNHPVFSSLFIPPLHQPNITLPSHPGPPIQQNQQSQQSVHVSNPVPLGPSHQQNQSQQNQSQQNQSQQNQQNQQPAHTNAARFPGPPPRPTPLQPPRPSPGSIIQAHLDAPAKKLIQIYLPGHLAPRKPGANPTDVLILGHTDSSATTLVLTHALFLPTTLRMMQRVRDGRATVLEAYGVGSAAHKAACEKLKFIWELVSAGPEEGREERVTKRWRAGKGAVWEGYGAFLNEGWEMVLGMEDREDRVGFRGVQ